MTQAFRGRLIPPPSLISHARTHSRPPRWLRCSHSFQLPTRIRFLFLLALATVCELSLNYPRSTERSSQMNKHSTTTSASILAPSAAMTAFISTAPVALSTASISFFQGARAPPVPLYHRPSTRRTRLTAMLSDPNVLLSANPAALQTVADAFNKLGLPEWLVEWGHPGLMTFMVLGMGLPGAVLGWLGRLNENRKAGVAQKRLHENIMIAFFLLAILGGTGGTLSVAMQGYDIWETPHFKSAIAVLALLGANSIIAYSGFTIGNDGSPKGRLKGRKLHAYFGIAAMTAFLVHGILGVKILLS